MPRTPKPPAIPSPDAVEAMLTALRTTTEPVTAAQVAKLTVKPNNLSEAVVLPLLEERVSRGELQAFPPASAKGKARFWDRDAGVYCQVAVVGWLNRKGPQTKAVALKAAKGIHATAAASALQALLDSRRVFEHPPIGKSKIVKFAATPPAPEPYLKEVSSQLATVVSRLTAVGVQRESLTEAVVAMMAECGLPFAMRAGSQIQPACELDLLMLIRQIEPGAERGALVSVRELRRAANLDKSEFDRAVLDLARSGRLMLHRHDYPGGLTPAERDELVADGAGTFFVGVAMRKSEC